MKLVSWNVNGLRSCLTKGFLEYVKNEDPDVICLQETKLQPEQAVFELEGYHRYFYSAEKKGYSGTAVLTRQEPISVVFGFGDDIHRHEGRVITAEYPDFYLVCCYTPNSQGRAEAAGLPDAVGGRPAGLSDGAGPDKARGILR